MSHQCLASFSGGEMWAIPDERPKIIFILSLPTIEPIRQALKSRLLVFGTLPLLHKVYFQFLTPPIPSWCYCLPTCLQYCIVLPNSNTFSWLWNVKLRSLLRPFYQRVRQWATLLPTFDRPPARCIQVFKGACAQACTSDWNRQRSSNGPSFCLSVPDWIHSVFILKKCSL